MSNQNTVAGVYNLPQFNVGGSSTSEFALMVPGPTPPTNITWVGPYYNTTLPNNGPNPYPGFPSPAYPVNSGLSITPTPDILGAESFDGRAFKVKLHAVIANGGGGNVSVKLYQVSAAQVGVIGAAGSVTTAGAPGTGATTTGTVTLTTPPATGTGVYLEYVFLWDSSSKILQGYRSGIYTSTSTGTFLALTATTNLTSISTISALNFMPSFTFATGGTNNVTVQEFSIERV
jgi:hypothetical protein